jgi:nicotinate-nucleotide--dimethylbenzimidazole phosphoribosyltransferase
LRRSSPDATRRLSSSNEVWLGIVPANELARRYRDVLPGEGSFADEAPRSFSSSRTRLRSRRHTVMTRGELFERTVASIRPPDEAAIADALRLLDAKTKPPGSLGRLEELACRVAGIRSEVPPRPLVPAIVVAAADHGVAARNVSAYPREVTAQMLTNFVRGGAAVCVLAREARARLVVVDAGVIGGAQSAGARSEIVDGVRGTDDLTLGPAMSRSTAIGAIERGIELAGELAGDGVEIAVSARWGSATTAASALTAALLTADVERVCGRGTGPDDEVRTQDRRGALGVLR